MAPLYQDLSKGIRIARLFIKGDQQQTAMVKADLQSIDRTVEFIYY